MLKVSLNLMCTVKLGSNLIVIYSIKIVKLTNDNSNLVHKLWCFMTHLERERERSRGRQTDREREKEREIELKAKIV